MRFREGKIALNADIREMFPQIKIIERDRDAQRFLWRDTPNEPIRTFRMSSMIFGAASSPFTAIYVKNKNALEWQETYPDAARAIVYDHYMDDCITSLDDVCDAAKLAADIYTIHSRAGFEMRGWTSNDPLALSLLPKESLLEATTIKDVDIDLGRLATPVRTLGLIWQPAHDVIGFNTGVKKEAGLPDKFTKREVLVHVMRIYDPLGILAPIVVRGRIMFEDAWRKGLDWDQELPQGDCAAWKLWYQDLISISSLRIPRRYNLSDLEVVNCELHLFSDARPDFLLSSDWPAEPRIDISGLGREEYKPSALVHLITESDLPIPVSANPNRFSSWMRMSQLDSFKEDFLRIKNREPLPRSSRLFKLSPFVDESDQLRMSSRIVATTAVTEELKRPLILDGKHQAVRLLIARYHEKAAHANKALVINELHQRFWIIGLRNAVRSVALNCQLCKLRRSRTFQPPMGDLPEARLAHHQRPFSYVGLDYFGPVHVTVGRRQEKRYVALYTCLVIRAIHLEVVHSLTTDAAIMCLRRFAARRGTPTEIWSDNGTAFVGTRRELQALYGDSVEDYAANESVNWRFIPPAAPFMGGAWERLIRSVKNALEVTLPLF
ncbi:uncharacterized protein [Choristoneura fumiferana]|uniref:uncharacterized protein n=1 Tax=Choristoneura fumiferana TaxID=7141 RepID=UPI003D1541B5